MLVSAVILGLLSSFHCLGMCGPIAFALPIDRSNSSKGALQSGLYHFGRLLAYGSIGLLFGLIGKGLYLSGFQQRLSILLGLLMILTAVLPMRLFNQSSLTRPLYIFIGRLKSNLKLYLNKSSYKALFSIGVLNGFLPCGMVYLAMIGAMATSEPLTGAVYMMFFGLGTIPVMSLAVYSKSIVPANLRLRFSKIIPVFVVLLGLLFILRGMGLGIPYVSPTEINLQVSNQTIECVD